MSKKYILAVLLLASFSTIFAQSQRKHTENNTGWLIYSGSHKFSRKWGLHLEGQFRRDHVVADPLQIILRPGLMYHFNGHATATVGYAFIETWPYGEFAAKSRFPENRFWQQVQLKHQIGIFELVHRFRLEQRLVRQLVLNGTVYEPGDAVKTNRVRILHRFSVPFKGKTIENGSFYVSVFDELMVNFGEKVTNNIFDQNRFSINLGHKFPKMGRFEIGYLNQWILKSDGIKVENNHTTMVGWYPNFGFR